MQSLTVLLIAEEENARSATLVAHLQAEGYQVLRARDGAEAIESAEHHAVSFLLLDLARTQGDGLDVCHRLRSQAETAQLPLILLAAHAEEVDVVIGLEVGADDYLAGPFRWRELHARMRALLRRTFSKPCAGAVQHTAHEQERLLTTGDLTIDLAGRTVYRQGQTLPLSQRAFDLLVYLMRSQGVVLTRRQIREQFWQDPAAPGNRVVDVQIHRLRVYLEEDPAHPSRILTIRGVGYRFTG